MKDLIITLFFIVGIILFTLLVEVRASFRCKEMYGEGWRTNSSIYGKYCTNEQGDMKGY